MMLFSRKLKTIKTVNLLRIMRLVLVYLHKTINLPNCKSKYLARVDQVASLGRGKLKRKMHMPLLVAYLTCLAWTEAKVASTYSGPTAIRCSANDRPMVYQPKING